MYVPAEMVVTVVQVARIRHSAMAGGRNTVRTVVGHNAPKSWGGTVGSVHLCMATIFHRYSQTEFSMSSPPRTDIQIEAGNVTEVNSDNRMIQYIIHWPFCHPIHWLYGDFSQVQVKWYTEFTSLDRTLPCGYWVRSIHAGNAFRSS